MSEIKWIKITTDIFDDEKIVMIETLPDADSIIVIWFKLLCLAGKQNNSGVFLFNDTIPYTDTMLATIFRRKESTVQLALKTFENFGMIEVIDGVITIPKWGKHQSMDALEKKTAYMREYMQEYRKRQKMLVETATSSESSDSSEPCKSNGNANVSRLDKIREEKEEDKEKEPPLNPPVGETIEIPFSGELREAFDDWLAYKQEKRQPYKDRGLKSLITQTKNYASKYGDKNVADVIRDSMASNYQGITFERLSKLKPIAQPKQYTTKGSFFDE